MKAPNLFQLCGRAIDSAAIEPSRCQRSVHPCTRCVGIGIGVASRVHVYCLVHHPLRRWRYFADNVVYSANTHIDCACIVYKKGFPIPTLDGIALINPEIVFDNGAIRIDTDIAYDPQNVPAADAAVAKAQM